MQLHQKVAMGIIMASSLVSCVGHQNQQNLSTKNPIVNKVETESNLQYGSTYLVSGAITQDDYKKLYNDLDNNRYFDLKFRDKNTMNLVYKRIYISQQDIGEFYPEGLSKICQIIIKSVKESVPNFSCREYNKFDNRFLLTSNDPDLLLIFPQNYLIALDLRLTLETGAIYLD